MAIKWGYTWPYDALPTAPQEAWDLLEKTDITEPAQVDSVLMASHTPMGDQARIAAVVAARGGTLIIRAKMGPQHQDTCPENGITYQEWPGSDAPTCEDAIINALGYGVQDIVVQLYNEIDIEMASNADDPASRSRVVAAYWQAWYTSSAWLHQNYPGVLIAAAPLSQGNNERFEYYCQALDDCYVASNVIIEHCYWPVNRDIEDQEWGGRWRRWRGWFPEKRIIIGEHNDNGTLYGADDVLRGTQYGNYIKHHEIVHGADTVLLFEAPATPGGADWWPVTSGMDAEIRRIVNLPVPVDPGDGGEPEPDWPYGERPWTQDEIIAKSNAMADHYGMPARMMLGLLIAESNLGQYARRPVKAIDDRRYWTDVSAGVAQQTVRWSLEYRGGDLVLGGHNPDVFPGAPEIERCMQLYWNPDHAINVAAKQLAGYWLAFEPDQLETMCRYNKPTLPGDQNPNQANYQRGLDEADKLLSGGDIEGGGGGETEAQPVAFSAAIYEDIWRGALDKQCDYGADNGIEKAWRGAGTVWSGANQGEDLSLRLGPTISQTERDGGTNESGASVKERAFANGVIRWHADKGAEVIWRG